MRKKVAQLYLDFEADEIDWLSFLRSAIEVGREAREDVSLFEEFLEVMETTLYPEEKRSYQTVELQCEYAAEIESLSRG